MLKSTYMADRQTNEICIFFVEITKGITTESGKDSNVAYFFTAVDNHLSTYGTTAMVAAQ